MNLTIPVIVRGLLLTGLIASTSVRAEVPRLPQGPIGERDITIVNRSEREVNEIYISPSSIDAWGEDRLGDATLAPDGNIKLKLGRMRDCAFDVQVIYDDASREQKLGHDVCRDRQVVFTGASAQLPAAVLGAQHRVMLRNSSGKAIQQLFISSAEASAWGDDLLPDRRIMVGSTAELTYHGACTADLRVVFENRAAEERRGLDLCETPALDIRPGWTTADAVPTIATNGIRLTNESGHAVLAFSLHVENGSNENRDLLGTMTLGNGQSIELPFAKGAKCRFDAHIVFDGAVPARDLKGLDLCTKPVIIVAP